MKNIHILALVGLLYTLLIFSCQPGIKMDLTLSVIFSDHMVLQQQEEVAFWGVYNPNEKVNVSASWGKEITAVSDEAGDWMLKLPTPEAGGPFEISISTKDSTIKLTDVLIGEVWLASGQSNMEMPLEGFLPNEPIDNYKEEIAAANYPAIRYFNVLKTIAPTPADNFAGEWHTTSPEKRS